MRYGGYIFKLFISSRFCVSVGGFVTLKTGLVMFPEKIYCNGN